MDIITVEHIAKTFWIGDHHHKTTLEHVLSVLPGREPRRLFCALDDVSFSVRKGEIFGIIGDNGSGKSTLLRIIAGILEQDSGSVAARGRIVPVINLDTTVKERLTMRENIILASTFLGLSRTQIDQRFNSIVTFAGLPAFVDTKWHKLSDGMKQKVIFSVGIHADPEILILDEAFSAGDVAFGKRSVATIRTLAQQGTTVLVVGHNLSYMLECADRVLWLAEGSVRAVGDPAQIIGDYRAYAT